MADYSLVVDQLWLVLSSAGCYSNDTNVMALYMQSTCFLWSALIFDMTCQACCYSCFACVQMRLIILETYDKVSEWAARYIKKRIHDFQPGPDRFFTLGLPTGY